MIQYSNEQLAIITTLPTVTVLLVWTIAIFHKNRQSWAPQDIPIVSVLTVSVLRNIFILCYFLTLTLGHIDLEYCSVVVWFFNAIHTFQATSLATLAVIGLFSVKLQREQNQLKHFLTPTHVIYHLFCLVTLCACVGVAAILGRKESSIGCDFMPSDLDIKYNVFIVVLHAFLSVISFASIIVACRFFLGIKRSNIDYLKKSNSDLSDASFANASKPEKNFYDTYTIQGVNKNAGNLLELGHSHSGFCHDGDVNWNSNMSNVSTTVSSTNSRRPCLGRNHRGKEDGAKETRTGLETIQPVLIVCYLFFHIPLIILCICPRLVHPWSVAGIALWLGLTQDLLIPIGLGIVDSRFCKWVSSVYKCSGKAVEGKLPHVGLDGKFRPFGTVSQPRSLDIANPDGNLRVLQAVEHRFPITNGSLYTSIDGRLPVIHNYRRNKDSRTGLKQMDKQSSNVAFHSNYSSRHRNFVDGGPFKIPSCSNCEADLCRSHSDLHHLRPDHVNRRLNLLQQKRISRSRESLGSVRGSRLRENFDSQQSGGRSTGEVDNIARKNSRNLSRLKEARLSRSEDGLDDVMRNIGDIHPNFRRPTVRETSPSIPPPTSHPNADCSSSDDDTNDVNDDTFDSTSSSSSYSMTTEANCDFHFFQNDGRPSIDDLSRAKDEANEFVDDKPVMTAFESALVDPTSEPDMHRNFKITRSNSKRSLENFQLFIEDDRRSWDKIVPSVQRSSSHVTSPKNRRPRDDIHPEFKMSDRAGHLDNFRSAEYLPGSRNENFPENSESGHRYFLIGAGECDVDKSIIGGSPDLKKVFISEYI